MNAPPIRIHIADGKIVCTPNGGHGRFQQRTVLEWPDPNFTLQFFTYDSNKTTPAWPFDPESPPPTSGTNGVTTPYSGMLKKVAPGDPAPSYTYSISQGTVGLDPIIIVDR